MNVFNRTALALMGALCTGSASAAMLTLAQYPLFLTTHVLPNLLVVYDNSESMDGTMAGKLIAGSDPTTRGNIARGVITGTINNFGGQFNWGLETFGTTDGPGPYTTYAYFIGDATTMNFTNDCVAGISASNGGLRCIANPQLGNGYNYLTYARTGDDPDINDVLYIGADWGPQMWALGVNGTTNYNIYLGHNVGSSTFNASDFNSGQGTWGFTPTDAGFLPSTPPYPRQVFVKRAWGYLSNISGRGVMAEAVKASSDTVHISKLQSLLAPETNNPSNPEIKNAALFTPLAGSFVTANQYFSGTLSGYTSPITLACQKSFVLLATDGNPTADLSGNMYSLAQQQNTYNATTSTWTFSQAANDVFTQVSSLRTISFGGTARDIQTYVVGLGDSVANASSVATLNRLASLGGTDAAYLANDASTLSAAFQAISIDIQSKTAAASAVSLNTASLTASANLFQARFNSGDWSGQLLAYPIKANGSIGAMLWDAGQVINGQNWDTGRAILTYKPSAVLGARGIPFRWPVTMANPNASEMDLTQATMLNTSSLGVVDGYGAQRVQFLRGNAANEKQTCPACVPAFRSRPTSKLGDIVRSAPNYVAGPAFGYSDSMESVAYSGFAATRANRTPMVYVGANDGMLHAFDAKTGAEKLAYIPSAVYPNLAALTGAGTTGSASAHHYSVDGSPTVGDVFYSGGWHTMLAGGLGAGGQGIYALDITDPTNFTETKASTVALWEFTDSNDVDVGYIFGQPLLVRTKAGWAVIIGNGYNAMESDGRASSTGHAVLFVLDAKSGQIMSKLDTGSGTPANPNGLSGPIGVDTGGDGVVDAVYAGDLTGHMWKFDLSATNATGWQVAFSGAPLFTTGGQPITVRPDVTKFTSGGYLVTFGTGQYLDVNDNATTGTQSFYGIRDAGASVVKTNLVRQSVVTTAAGSDGNPYRITTHAVGPATLDGVLAGDNQITTTAYAGRGGWYIDLPDLGERAVTEPSIRAGRVVFNTIVPSTDPCSYGGSGWVMEVDVMTGNRYDAPTFDTNGDLTISVADLISAIGAPRNTSGRRIASIPAAAGYMRVPQPAGKTGYENKYLNTSSGDVSVVGETAGSGGQGRVSWRQLQ